MTELANLKKEVTELRTRLDDFERLFNIIRSVSSSLQVEDVLKMIISEAISLCHTDQGSIILFDPDEEKLTKTLIRSSDQKKYSIDSALNNVLAGWVYDNRSSLLTDDLSGLFGEKIIKPKHRHISSVLSVPILKADKMIGVINLISLHKKVHFAARERQLMELLATQCVHLIVNAGIHESLFQEKNRLRRELHKTYAFSEVIGSSPKLQEVFSLLERIIPTDARVMIEGESGQDKAGLFEEAHNGTLFLDEITNMPLSIQSKLLRVLQEGEIRPLGSTKVKKVNVRVLSAASDNLKERMEAGTFREDLYYRLSVVTVKLPPLRERSGDIVLLTDHFLKKYAEKYQKQLAGLKSETFQLMESYHWPGNIRELENVIERLIILAEPGTDYIPPELLPDSILVHTVETVPRQSRTSSGKSLSIQKKKADYERDMIIKALQKNNWNQSLAAEELGLHESTLRYKMRKFGIKKG